MPRNLQGLTDVLIDPAYATSVGLLQWAVNEAEASAWHRAPGRVARPQRRLAKARQLGAGAAAGVGAQVMVSR